jgi:hypothetical protein
MTRIHRTSSAFVGVVALAASGGAIAAVAAPPSTEPPVPPIAVEELTRIDAETPSRGGFTDGVGATLRYTLGGFELATIEVPDLSHVAVAKITVQPGAMFPWHTHPGPVIVNVVDGDFVYVRADDCVERPYGAGSAFIDPGRESVHTAFNPGDVETNIVAVFTEVTADGPLTITEGVTAPADNCGLPAAMASH